MSTDSDAIKDPAPVVSADATLSFPERAAEELTRTYPERMGKRTKAELLGLIERGSERARGYGLEKDEHILKFLRCVILLDNDLAKPTTSDITYILNTLTAPGKPPDRRIEQALSIAMKIAAAASAAADSSGLQGDVVSPRMEASPRVSPSFSAPAQLFTPAVSDAAPVSHCSPPETVSPPSTPQRDESNVGWALPASDITADRGALNPGSTSMRPVEVPASEQGSPVTMKELETSEARQPLGNETPAFVPSARTGPTRPSSETRLAPVTNARTESAPPASETAMPPHEPPSHPSPAHASNSPMNISSGVTAEPVSESIEPGPAPTAETGSSNSADATPDIQGFRILEKIASGGMGIVYRAQDLRLDIEVAIKVVRSLHPAAQQQFLQEARAAARLQHPNVIPVLRHEQYGQGGYCVMQLVKGKDAHRLAKSFGEQAAHDLRGERLLEIAGIDRAMMNPALRDIVRGPPPYYRMVAYWLAGVAEGLDRAHTEGIIHYDVKPSNIMLGPDGRMMLGDFGLATLAGQQQASGACVGTPTYLSPEMLAAWASRSGTSETDARVDVWGLGCTLYEMLTYKPAFEGNVSRVLRAIATTDPVPPRNIVWSTPAALEQICLKALSRNPDLRYAGCLSMADALREFLAGKGGTEDQHAKSRWPWGKRG